MNVQFTIKDKTEWKPFITSICKCYGFDDYKLCPIVYTLEGELVGDGNAFIEHIKERYDINLTLTKEQLKARSKLNVDVTDDRIRKRDDGDTLGEKIEKYLQKDFKSKERRNVVKLIDDAFYEKEWDGGVPFYVRRTNLLRDFSGNLNHNRTKNIPDSA